MSTVGMTVGAFVMATVDEFGVEEEVVKEGMEEGGVGEAMDVGAAVERG